MKNLPIQIVEFRERQDDFLAEGLGGKDVLQSWIRDNMEICQEHSRRVYGQMNEWLALFDEREQQQNNMPLLFEVQLHQKAEAKSYRRDVNTILNPARDKNVLGMTNRRTLLVKADTRRALQRIAGQFEDRAIHTVNSRTLRAYASIESVSLFHPIVEDGVEGQAIKIKLADYGNEHFNNECESHLRQLCELYHQPFEELNYAEGLRLYKTKAVSQEFIRHLATIDGVLSVQKMPYITLNVYGEQFEEGLPCKAPQEGINHPHVGLLDTGIAETVEPIRLWMDGNNQIPVEWDPADASKDHGTRVASILLYGDELCEENRTCADPCKIRSCVVNTNPRRMRVLENECLDLIKKAIERNLDIKVWSSSMGSESEAPMTEFSDYAKALDELQQKHNILICKSAGNKKGEENRITSGADSVLSLVVGATTYEINQNGDNVENWSPISRLGLAAGSIIKPDLANLGGDEANPIRVISECGTMIGDCGTSYAVPRIAAMAATIAHKLGEKFDPLLIKALLIHHASYPQGMEAEEMEEKVRKVGFGIPQNIEDIMHNDSNEITMIFPCHFRKGIEYQVAKFIYPEGLVENGFFYGDITITLVAKPILDVNQATEYCQSDVEVGLYTYASEKIIDPTDVEAIGRHRNPLYLEGVENVLLEGKYSKKRKDVSTLFECNRIDKLHKFSPVKKFHVNLENMTDASKRDALSANRQWALKLIPGFRVEAENSIARDDLQFDAYLIMTIRDTRERGIAYNQAIRQLDNRNFIHQNIEVRQDIDIDNAN